jgi:hypothetical protein
MQGEDKPIDTRGHSRMKHTSVSLLMITLLVLIAAISQPLSRGQAAATTRDDMQAGSGRQVFLPLVRGPSVFGREPNPLTLTVALDQSRATRATLPTTGGTLTATAADGTRFTLTLPRDALLLPTTITLTPVVGVSGLPNGVRFVAGVDILPDGLRLYQPATLVIEPPAGKAVPIEREVSFASHSRGRQAHRYPLRVQPRTPTFDLFHFSSYYLGDGIWMSDSAPYVPAYTEDQIQQLLDDLLREERQAQLLGQPGDPLYAEKVEFLLREYYLVAIMPHLIAAEGHCGTAQRIIPKAISWSRMNQLMTGDETFATENAAIIRTWIRSVESCWQEVTTPCLPRRIPSEMDRAASIAQEARLLGMPAEKYDLQSVPGCDCSSANRITNGWTATVSFNWRSQWRSYLYDKVHAYGASERAAEVTARLDTRPYGTWVGAMTGFARVHETRTTRLNDPLKEPLTTVVTGSGKPATAESGRPIQAQLGVDTARCAVTVGLPIQVEGRRSDTEGYNYTGNVWVGEFVLEQPVRWGASTRDFAIQGVATIPIDVGNDNRVVTYRRPKLFMVPLDQHAIEASPEVNVTWSVTPIP